MTKLSVGVVGVGHLGKLHTKMFKQIDNCELVGVFDSNPNQAKLAADEFGVKSFNSIDDLLSKVKAVSVAQQPAHIMKLQKNVLKKIYTCLWKNQSLPPSSKVKNLLK